MDAVMIGAMRPDLVFILDLPTTWLQRRRGILCLQKEWRQLLVLRLARCDKSPRLFFASRAEHMTGNAVLAVEFEPWLLLGAALPGEGTARMEAASRRRIDRARDVALQHGTCALARGIRHRHGREQRTRIRVL